jgi:hypothetical protein
MFKKASKHKKRNHKYLILQMNPLDLQGACQSNALPTELQPHINIAEFVQLIAIREIL